MSQARMHPQEDARPRVEEDRCWFGDPTNPITQSYLQQGLDQGFPRFVEDPWVIAQIARLIKQSRSQP